MGQRSKLIHLLHLLIILMIVGGAGRPAFAASQAECAIWLCLPSGFSVSECGAAYSAFVQRLRKGKPPLPPLASCMIEESGAADGNSRYEMGYERWESCKSGFVPLDYLDPLTAQRVHVCVNASCPNKQPDVIGRLACDHYIPQLRPKPNFIKLWVGGEYQGQYFY